MSTIIKSFIFIQLLLSIILVHAVEFGVLVTKHFDSPDCSGPPSLTYEEYAVDGVCFTNTTGTTKLQCSLNKINYYAVSDTTCTGATSQETIKVCNTFGIKSEMKDCYFGPGVILSEYATGASCTGTLTDHKAYVLGQCQNKGSDSLLLVDSGLYVNASAYSGFDCTGAPQFFLQLSKACAVAVGDASKDDKFVIQAGSWAPTKSPVKAPSRAPTKTPATKQSGSGPSSGSNDTNTTTAAPTTLNNQTNPLTSGGNNNVGGVYDSFQKLVVLMVTISVVYSGW
jgi:hypothetical protein